MSGSFLAPVAALAPDEDDALALALRAAVQGITGLAAPLVRPLWQRVAPLEPEIGVNWAAVGVIHTTPDDSPWIGHQDTINADPLQRGQSVLQRHVRIEMQASFYGPASQTNAGLLRDGISIPPNRYVLENAGIVIHDVGESMHVPDLVGMEWRNRVDMRVMFGRQIDRTYLIRNIVSSSFVPTF